MKKVAQYFLLLLIIVFVYVTVNQYFFSKKYYFLSPKPFMGQKFYNPYIDLKGTKVHVANFHAHAQNGLLNGKGTGYDIINKYNSIGVDIVGISQYQKIDQSNQVNEQYIPVYEHGVNLEKSHQLVIGAKKILDRDFISLQTLNNKQAILEKLAHDSQTVIALAHPGLNGGYKVEDVKYLHYYDHIEVLSPFANSISYWDTALTSGKPVFALGNDDIHDVNDDNELGRFLNLIYLNEKDESVVNVLKEGRTCVLWLKQETGESLYQKKVKIEQSKNVFSKLTVQSDTTTVFFNQKIEKLDIYTNYGRLAKSFTSDSVFQFIFPTESSYIRCEATLFNGSKLLLNPVFRSSDNVLNKYKMATNFLIPDEFVTFNSSFILLLTYSIVYFLMNVYRLRKRKSEPRLLYFE